ncbi:glycosyltransferase [candidate division KSB1 bacterium]|nr:glycosyltransferase [candidate division KSB1 bacterium]
MIALLYGLIALLGVLLLVTLFNLFAGPRLRRAPAMQSSPFVSLLIPARNEAAGIEDCLGDLRAQDYPNFEILVLDDGSTDQTAALVQRHAEQDHRIQLLQGAALPHGWLGKNWACHQLSLRARGEIFIFTDADLRYAPHAVAHTMGWMQQLELGMLSAFSQQLTHTFAEKLIVPVLDMFVYSYLPLWLTYFARSASLAAANGHWLAFTRQAYLRIGGHAEVRHEVVEDVELSRRAKRMGERILTVCGKSEIFGRMYSSVRGIWAGYSKNLFGLVRFQTAPFLVLITILALIHILPYLLVWSAPYTKWAGLAIAVNVLLRFLLALGYAHPLFTSVVFHPVAIAAIIVIGLNSLRWHKTGRLRWKGRTFTARAASR